MTEKRNWPAYNKSLVERGSLFFCFDPKILEKKPEHKNKKGRPFVFCDEFILMILMIKYQYSLGYRQTYGFLLSLMSMFKITARIPHWTTLCSRARLLKVFLSKTEERKKLRGKKNLYIAIDATGLKFIGEHEWKCKVHGAGKRRQWRKLHVGVDVKSKKIMATEMTLSNVHDSQEFSNLLKQVNGPVESVICDGAYDQKRCYDIVKLKGGRSVFQIRKNARFWKNKNQKLIDCERNRHLSHIKKFGEEDWKKKENDHKRSIVENVFSRYKTIFGERMSSREFQRQITETQVKCALLNKMTENYQAH